jgi:2-polyprenyl-6-methoxyphenol hydroxylase-like FAD-dependent oxidoreductase
MVGALLAACLGKKGVPTALVEGLMPAPLSSILPIRTPDLRVSSLNHSSTQLLDAVGAWQLIQSASATPYTSMEVWDTNGGLISFDDNGKPLGHIVENRVTIGALYEVIRSHQVKAIHGEAVAIKKEKGITCLQKRGKEDGECIIFV